MYVYKYTIKLLYRFCITALVVISGLSLKLLLTKKVGNFTLYISITYIFHVIRTGNEISTKKLFLTPFFQYGDVDGYAAARSETQNIN